MLLNSALSAYLAYKRNGNRFRKGAKYVKNAAAAAAAYAGYKLMNKGKVKKPKKVKSSASETQTQARNNIGIEPGHEARMSFKERKHRKKKTKKALRKAKRQKKKRLQAFKKIMFYRMGFMHRYEGINTHSDTGVVYVSCTSNPSHMVRYALGWALLRTLFRKAKINITELHEVPRLGTDGAFTATTQDFMIEITRTEIATGTTSYASYQIPGSSTIGSLVGLPGYTAIHTNGTWTDFHDMYDNLIGTYVSGTTNTLIFDKISLYARDNLSAIGVLAPAWNLVTTLDLENTVFYFKSLVDMKVQNRTLSQDATSNAESTSASPLEGKIYYCNTGCPRLRDVEGIAPGLGYFMVDDLHGSRKFGNSSFTALSMLQRVPPKNYIRNCKQAKKVYLAPGVIESISFSHEMKGKLKDLVPKIKNHPYQSGGVGTIIWENRNSGKSILIALEDVVNIGANNITIAYEINRWIGCYCVENKKQLLSKGALYTATTET